MKKSTSQHPVFQLFIKFSALFVSFAVLSAAVSACSKMEGDDSNSEISAPVSGGQIVFALNDLPTSWNPASTAWAGPATTIARTFLDPLVVVDENGSWAPYLAESFTPNENSTVWDIKLRENIFFHDGTPLTANALFLNMQNARSGIVLGPPLANVLDITEIGPLTLRITLTERHANFPLLFTSQGGYVLAPATLEAFTTGKPVNKPIGTGPWMFSVEDNKGVIVTKNQNYWRKDQNGNQLPYLDKIEFRLEPDVLTRSILLESGNYDALLDNTPSQIRSWQEGNLPEGFNLVEDLTFSDRTYGSFNTQEGAFRNVLLRQAAVLAADRETIAESVGGGFPVTDGPYSPQSQWHAPSGWPKRDTTKAQELVAKATAENGGVPPKISLIVSQGVNQLQLAQQLEKDWERVGFEVEVKSFPADTFIVQLVTGQFDVAVVQQFSGADPVSDESFWRGQTIRETGSISLNFPRFSNEVIEEGLRQGRAVSDYETRKAGYTAVWREWAKEYPYLFLFNSPQAAVSSSRVVNLGEMTTPEGTQAAPFSWGGIWLTETWATR